MKSNSRYLGALIMAPFIAFIFLGGIWLKLFTIALSFAGLYEYYKTVKVAKLKPISIGGYILLILYYLTSNNFEMLSFLIIIATFILLCVPILNIEYTFTSDEINRAISYQEQMEIHIGLFLLEICRTRNKNGKYSWG